jgi:hypothetical protein
VPGDARTDASGTEKRPPQGVDKIASMDMKLDACIRGNLIQITTLDGWHRGNT